MKLIGMLDSPFVRRCAISARLLDIPFERLDWSVGRDFDRIREFSPLGRVPALVLDDGEVLTESSAILDYLDERAGPSKALLPATGAPRREALRVMSCAIGAAEKGRDQIYEAVMRPAEKKHPPWSERLNKQMHGALGQVEAACAARRGRWLVGDRMTQADITVACVFALLSDTVLRDAATAYPEIAALAARCEKLPAFKETRTPFFVPAAS